jgi:two-component system, OmpR family, response regulator
MTINNENELTRPRGSIRAKQSRFGNQAVATFEPPAANASVDHRSPTCLIVEDDNIIRRLVTNYLEDHHIQTASTSRRDKVGGLLARDRPDLVVLDLRLGQEDGLELLREIRAQSDVPIIIITGHRCDEADRVVGLELGADDYITKPFGLRELLARIRAVLRRRKLGRAAHRDVEKGSYRFGGWQLNRRTRRLTNPAGEIVALTRSEYGLLIAFLDAPQCPLSRLQLLQATGADEDVFDRSVDVRILRLRRKLDLDPNTPSMIQTERSFGYVFSLPVEFP